MSNNEEIFPYLKKLPYGFYPLIRYSSYLTVTEDNFEIHFSFKIPGFINNQTVELVIDRSSIKGQLGS